MTKDKTKARATNRNELVERTRDKIILEHMDLQITVINLESPEGWKESAFNVETQNISQDRNGQLKMQSARTVTK